MVSYRIRRTHRIYYWVFSHRFHGNTQIVRVRIIKTTKYAHVKDGEVADSIAVEHNVLATFFPTLFHRRRTETDRTANANGGTLRGCTCLRSALPLARARSASTEQEMHQQSKSCTKRARAAPSASVSKLQYLENWKANDSNRRRLRH